MKINKSNNQISFNKPSVDKVTFEKEINLINEKIKELEKNDGGGSGEGLTQEQREQLEEAYQYSQIDHVEQDEFDDLNDTVLKILDIVDSPPSYSRPSVSLSLSTSRVEHNVTTTVTISSRFSQNDGGAMTSYQLRKNSTILSSGSTFSSYRDTIIIPHDSTITYSITVYYADGAIKNTALGVPYPNTSIKAGNTSSSASIRAYAPSYYGVIDGNSITESDISNLTRVINTSRSTTITYSLTKQRSVFMYPRSFGNISSIKDSNNFEYINSYTLNTMTYNGVEYNVYILTNPVTINGFRQIFN